MNTTHGVWGRHGAKDPVKMWLKSSKQEYLPAPTRRPEEGKSGVASDRKHPSVSLWAPSRAYHTASCGDDCEPRENSFSKGQKGTSGEKAKDKVARTTRSILPSPNCFQCPIEKNGIITRTLVHFAAAENPPLPAVRLCSCVRICVALDVALSSFCTRPLLTRMPMSCRVSARAGASLDCKHGSACDAHGHPDAKIRCSNGVW